MHNARENVQATLGTPDVIEMTFRVGLVVSTNHGQWQYEVKDASGDTLLEMGSKHHFHSGDWQDELLTIAELLRDLLGSYVDPF